MAAQYKLSVGCVAMAGKLLQAAKVCAVELYWKTQLSIQPTSLLRPCEYWDQLKTTSLLRTCEYWDHICIVTMKILKSPQYWNRMDIKITRT